MLAVSDHDDDPIVGMWHVKFTAEGNTGSGAPDGTPNRQRLRAVAQ